MCDSHTYILKKVFRERKRFPFERFVLVSLFHHLFYSVIAKFYSVGPKVFEFPEHKSVLFNFFGEGVNDSLINMNAALVKTNAFLKKNLKFQQQTHQPIAFTSELCKIRARFFDDCLVLNFPSVLALKRRQNEGQFFCFEVAGQLAWKRSFY